MGYACLRMPECRCVIDRATLKLILSTRFPVRKIQLLYRRYFELENLLRIFKKEVDSHFLPHSNQVLFYLFPDDPLSNLPVISTIRLLI